MLISCFYEFVCIILPEVWNLDVFQQNISVSMFVLRMFSPTCLQMATHSLKMRTGCCPSLRSSEPTTPPSSGPMSGEIRLDGPPPSAATLLLKAVSVSVYLWPAWGTLGNNGYEKHVLVGERYSHLGLWKETKIYGVVCWTADTSTVLEYFLPSLRSV